MFGRVGWIQWPCVVRHDSSSLFDPLGFPWDREPCVLNVSIKPRPTRAKAHGRITVPTKRAQRTRRELLMGRPESPPSCFSIDAEMGRGRRSRHAHKKTRMPPFLGSAGGPTG